MWVAVENLHSFMVGTQGPGGVRSWVGSSNPWVTQFSGKSAVSQAGQHAHSMPPLAVVGDSSAQCDPQVSWRTNLLFPPLSGLRKPSSQSWWQNLDTSVVAQDSYPVLVLFCGSLWLLLLLVSHLVSASWGSIWPNKTCLNVRGSSMHRSFLKVGAKTTIAFVSILY